jgi:conjugative transfer region lipoprotein (TIGR03751 family)
MKQLCLLAACLFLCACGTSHDELLPVDKDTTMLKLWNRHTGGVQQVTLDQSGLFRPLTDIRQTGEVSQSYTRTAANEIEQLFPRLPNPDLVMYVYPHLSGNEPVPVPGYSTVFPFYSRIQYALPGERLEEI